MLTDSESQPLLIEMTTGRILRSRKCVKADITCKVCNQVCQSNYSYNRHIKIHDRPFKCLACFKSFDTSKQLNNHLQLHKITPIKLNSDTVENVDALLNVEISNEKIENNQTLNEKVSCKICRILVDDDEMLMVHRYEHMST